MLKKTITYTDFDGNEQSEELYFNLSFTELTEMEMSEAGGLSAKLQAIIDSTDQSELLKLFKDIVLKAYGVKSPDGKRFVKSEELSAEFCQTAAYDALFEEFLTDSESAAAFINGIVPKSLAPNTANISVAASAKA